MFDFIFIYACWFATNNKEEEEDEDDEKNIALNNEGERERITQNGTIERQQNV